MGKLEEAHARSNAYHLLGRLFEREPQQDMIPMLEMIPELGLALQAASLEQLAVEHHRVFSMNVFPFEDIFLGKDNLIGGSIAEEVRASYRQAGFSAGLLATANPGHIGTELNCLSWLCGAEADALEDHQLLITTQMRKMQFDFLSQHVLRWILPLTFAIQRQESHFFEALSILTLSLVTDHWHDLTQTIVPERPERIEALESVSPAILDDEKTGLKDIAAYLLTPVLSGLFIGVSDIASLGNVIKVPRGFGSRLQMLTNLLRGTVDYETLPALLDIIDQMILEWTDFYARHTDLPHTQEWQAKLAGTRNLLNTMRQKSDLLRYNLDLRK